MKFLQNNFFLYLRNIFFKTGRKTYHVLTDFFKLFKFFISWIAVRNNNAVARNFVIMRPDASPYVIFHSEEDVTAPQILLTVNVMGDPNSPYQMRLSIPENGGDRTMMAMGGDNGRQGARRGGRGTNSFRKVPAPMARTDLPPK